MYDQLQKAFPGRSLALIHSRIPDDEKKARMEGFSTGSVDLLVATSVVEVGVDVPNATIMVIEHAERFGLSALHQLRGRVGRSDIQSFAFLIYSNNLTEEGKKRLKVMMENSDGFIIAEEDLKLRGPGEIAGVRQSGYMKFRIADMIRDSDILMQARRDVIKILEDDPALIHPENKVLQDLWECAPPFSETLIRTG
jgi:ATP-dependent DNA helicase RecG